MLVFKIKGFCHVCNKCLRFKPYEVDGYVFCKKHFIFYCEHNWVSFKTYYFYAEDDRAALLEDFRIKLYQERHLVILQKMSYLEKNSRIVTMTQLFCLKKEQEELKAIFKQKGPSEDGPPY